MSDEYRKSFSSNCKSWESHETKKTCFNLASAARLF